MKPILHWISARWVIAFFGWMLPIAAAAFVLGTAQKACADVIILKNGKRITTEHHWIDKDWVKFKVQGLDAGVPQREVLRIEKEPSPDSDKESGNERQGAASVGDEKNPMKGSGSAPAPEKPEKKHLPLSDVVAALPEGRIPTGFRSLYWKMPKNEIPALAFVGTDPALGGINQFVVPDEHLRFGGAPVTRIIYGFQNDKLLAITFWVFDRNSYEQLKKEVFEKFGQGLKNVDGLERYIWYGGPTDRLLEFDAEKNTGILWMRARRLWKQLERKHTRPKPYTRPKP